MSGLDYFGFMPAFKWLGIFVGRIFVFAILTLGLGACAAAIVRNPVPREISALPALPGFGSVRIWGDEAPKNFRELMRVKLEQTKSGRPQVLRENGPGINFLAISGGGAEGAFGAGLLAGWSKNGTRPEFDVVTGVSTGALAAPFVFLGSEYDDELREIYTHYSTKQLFSLQLFAGLLGNAGGITDNSGLKKLIAKYFDARVLAAIGREHLKGRRLLIGTTNLDAQRPVIWDIGGIALHGGVEALRLAREVLLASAALPGVFPPVMVNVAVGGERFREMHVDGGPTAEVFFLPTNVVLARGEDLLGSGPRRRLFVIRNGKVTPEWEAVKYSTVDIAQRSLLTLTKAQGKGDLLKLYSEARMNNIEYNLASIPAEFQLKSAEAFDRDYMTALFEFGFELGASGYDWAKKPPR